MERDGAGVPHPGAERNGVRVTAREFCARFDVALTPEQSWACAWLEFQGKRFLIDFGYANAVDLVSQDMLSRPFRVH